MTKNNAAQNVVTTSQQVGDAVEVESVTGTVVQRITGWKDVEAMDTLTEDAYAYLVERAHMAVLEVARVAYLVQTKATESITLTRLALDLDVTKGRLSQLGSTYSTLVRLNVPRNADTWKIAAAFNREVKSEQRESLIATAQAENGVSATERLARVAELTRTTRDAKAAATSGRANVQVPAIGSGDPDNGDIIVPTVDMTPESGQTSPAPDAEADGQKDKSESREAQPDVREIATDNVSSWSKAEFLAALTKMAAFVESDRRQWALKTEGETIRATDALERIAAAVTGASINA